MPIRFFNTMSRSLEEFRPLEEGVARLYTCGPTVHDFAHIGNFRTYIFEDVLRRYLKFRGFRVIQVMNITDVEDKIIRKTRAAGKPMAEVTEPYIQAFFADLDRLNIERAEHYPRATEHLEKMVEMIRALLESGHAYRSEDGSIYYAISRYPEYGRLAHMKVEDLQCGARVAQDEYEKASACDFALWKAWDADDGDVFWDAWPDLGKGRPGWHIECSAMSTQYLGDHFDLHTGGVDNIFPHHQNEIAQTEPCTGQRFVNYWLHSEHLVVEGKKMSKSLGNFFTLRDLLEKGHDEMAIRYLMINARYRTRLDFTFQGLEDATKTLQGLVEFLRACRRAEGDGPADPEILGWISDARERFELAMDDDLNTPEALAALHVLRRDVNRAENLNRRSGEAVVEAFLDLDRVLGLRLSASLEEPTLTDEEQALVEERQAARTARDFARSDRLRDELKARGVLLEDTPQGVVWKIERSRR